MSTGVLLLLSVSVALLTGTAVYAFWLRERVVQVSKERAQKKSSLDKTAKLLVEKNLELFDQNVRQQKQIETKEDFVEIVAHQLRTPATEVVWGLDELKTALDGKLDQDQKEYVQKMLKSAQRMVRLIDDLVKLVSFGESYARIPSDPYSPDDLVRSIAERVAAKFEDKKIHLSLSLNAPLTINSIHADALDMIASNLIENAYHYTPNTGAVSVTTGKDSDGRFFLKVTDTGMGISKEKQKTIFKKFQRSDSAVRVNSEGMGLGLYIVHTIAERHGGTMTFTSEEGHGSTFIFTGPVNTSHVQG